MDKEAVFKKLKFGVAENSLVVNAPEEFLQALAGADFDTIPSDSKMGKYGYVQYLLHLRPKWKIGWPRWPKQVSSIVCSGRVTPKVLESKSTT